MNQIGTKYSIHVFWYDREESLEVCTDKSWEFLQEYMAIVPCSIIPFYAYKFKGKQEILDRNFVQKALKKGVIRTNVPPYPIMSDLGFSLALWPKEPKHSIDIHCGVYSTRNHNSVSIGLPLLSEDTSQFYQEEFLKKLFELMIRHWQPDHGEIWNADIWQSYNYNVNAGDVRIGWLTYLSFRYGELPRLPAWAEIKRINNLGTVIATTKHLTNATNHEDVLKVSELSTILDPFYKIPTTPTSTPSGQTKRHT